MKRLCIVCARAGSKGVPSKNIRPFAGKPLIAHTIGQAIETGLFDEIAVSSDSDEILEAAGRSGATKLVRRPEEMATDQAAKMQAIVHCAQEVEKETGVTFNTLVDLDATAPLRLAEDITAAVERLETTDASNLFSVCPAHRSPYFNMVERGQKGRVQLVKSPDRPLVRRQDAPPCYDMNASIYVWRRDAFGAPGNGLFLEKTELYVMPAERSIDIDSEFDFAIAEFLFSRENQEK